MPSPKSGTTVNPESPAQPRSATEAGDASTGSASAAIQPEAAGDSHPAKGHSSSTPSSKPASAGGKAKDPKPSKAPKAKVLHIRWLQNDGWCSDSVNLAGETENYADGDIEKADVTRSPKNGKVKSVALNIKGNAFNSNFPLLEILPEKVSGVFPTVIDLNASASGEKTPAPLYMNFIPGLTKVHCSTGRFADIPPMFDLSCDDYVLLLASDIKYVKGWARYIIDLQGTATPEPDGVLNLTMYGKSNWRWSQVSATGTQQYWVGSAWVDVPPEWADATGESLYGMGVWKVGTKYPSQTGIDYPEALPDWDTETHANKAVLNGWIAAIKTKWADSFYVKRTECRSAAATCCKYKLKVDVKFELAASKTNEVVVLAEGDVRANAGMWPLGRPATTATHEWGHHLGNPDEYDGQQVATYEDPDDGLVHGLDTTGDSVMNDKTQGTKRRHYGAVLDHLAKMVHDQYNVTFKYECRPV